MIFFFIYFEVKIIAFTNLYFFTAVLFHICHDQMIYFFYPEMFKRGYYLYMFRFGIKEAPYIHTRGSNIYPMVVVRWMKCRRI